MTILVIFKQKINDYALYFKTSHSRISSQYPLVNFPNPKQCGPQGNAL